MESKLYIPTKENGVKRSFPVSVDILDYNDHKLGKAIKAVEGPITTLYYINTPLKEEPIPQWTTKNGHTVLDNLKFKENI